jgi:DNA-binding response OmpR family regulator
LAKVLIVDDDPDVVRTFAHMLRLEGYEVLTAFDGETALREIETSRPDAVLLDLRMPLTDGLTFLRRLRAREGQRHTPVAIVTADYAVDETTTNELRELEAVLHFKPLWLEDLVDITRRLLHRTS